MSRCIADTWPADRHKAIRDVQKAIFIINMNLHKPDSPVREGLMERAILKIVQAAEVLREV